MADGFTFHRPWRLHPASSIRHPAAISHQRSVGTLRASVPAGGFMPRRDDRRMNQAADAIEQQVVAFAEQLGRVVGTVQAKSEGWLDPKALADQVSRIRDGASLLLQELSAAAERTTRITGAAGAGRPLPRSSEASRPEGGAAGSSMRQARSTGSRWPTRRFARAHPTAAESPR